MHFTKNQQNNNTHLALSVNFCTAKFWCYVMCQFTIRAMQRYSIALVLRLQLASQNLGDEARHSMCCEDDYFSYG